MISEGEVYRQYQIRTWFARTGEKQGAEVPDGNGVSYCYGCKDDVPAFDAYVSLCQAANTDLFSSPTSTWRAYRGRVNESTCVIDSTYPRRQWPGLIDVEQKKAANSSSHFWPTYWSGVDCSGFIQRLLISTNTAYGTSLGINIKIPALVYSHVTDLVDKEVASDGFVVSDTAFNINTQSENQIKRGDVVQYEGHAAIVYSQGWGVSSKPGRSYDIIHAYGSRFYRDEAKNGTKVFSRKVMVTGNVLPTKVIGVPLAPNKLGRFQLWD